MAWEKPTTSFQQAGTDVAYSEGLRKHMLSVYNYMTMGLCLTAVVSLLFANLCFTETGVTPLGHFLFTTPFKYVVMLAPLGIVMLFSMRFASMSSASLKAIYWTYAAALGVSLSTIFITFAKADIVSAFAVTSLTFGAMSLWGYTTKRDLTSMGSFLMMGLIGVIVASLVNLFLQSGMMSFIISCIGALVFTGLTAYDTQKIKETYFMTQEGESRSKAAISGALSLYMDFINLFISLLNIMRSR